MIFEKGWLADFAAGVLRIIQRITVVDVIDILVVAVILYYAFRFVRERRAGKLAAGVILVIVFLVISDMLGMHALQYIFQNIFQVGVIALVILFQPELRSALEKMGGSSLKGIKHTIGEKESDSMLLSIREVCSAAGDMSASKTGALIVFERTTRLGEIVSTGTIVDAQTGAFLIKNIFFNKAPLHDGALIIRDGRAHAAGCLLPLSAQSDINKDLGTRHRAALGLSENSDAVVVVVSEETGIISVAVDARLTRGYNTDTLRARLIELLVPDTEKESDKSAHQKRKKRLKKAERAAKEANDENN